MRETQNDRLHVLKITFSNGTPHLDAIDWFHRRFHSSESSALLGI